MATTTSASATTSKSAAAVAVTVNGRLPAKNSDTAVVESPFGRVTPIRNITIHSGALWTIRGRVTAKSDLRTINGAHMFNFALIDDSGAEIQVTVWRDLCEARYAGAPDIEERSKTFFERVSVGQCYYLNGGKLQVANKAYQGTVENDTTIIATTSTRLLRITDADVLGELPYAAYHFRPLGEVPDMKAGELVDVLCIVVEAGELQQVTAQRSGNTLLKREVVLADRDMKKCLLTLWGDMATSFAPESTTVLAVKAAQVSDFGGRSLSTAGSVTILTPNPTTRERDLLELWWMDHGANEKHWPSMSKMKDAQAELVQKVAWPAEDLNGISTPVDEAGEVYLPDYLIWAHVHGLNPPHEAEYQTFIRAQHDKIKKNGKRVRADAK